MNGNNQLAPISELLFEPILGVVNNWRQLIQQNDDIPETNHQMLRGLSQPLVKIWDKVSWEWRSGDLHNTTSAQRLTVALESVYRVKDKASVAFCRRIRHYWWWHALRWQTDSKVNIWTLIAIQKFYHCLSSVHLSLKSCLLPYCVRTVDVRPWKWRQTQLCLR